MTTNLLLVSLGLTWVACKASTSQKSASLKHVEDVALHGHGDFSTAREELKILLKKYPQDIDVHLAAARFYRTIGLLEQSQAEYKRAIELGCKKSEPLIALAEIYLANLDNKQALAYARKALALEPDSREALIALIAAQLNEGQLKEAQEELNAQMDANKNITDPNLSYLEYRLNRLNRQRRELLLERRYLDDAIKRKPEQTHWLLDRADLYQSFGDESSRLSDRNNYYKKAKDTLEEFLHGEPRSIEGLSKLGTILEFYYHDFDSAMEKYKVILEIDPENVAAITGLDRCKAKKNDLAGQMKLEFWKTIGQPLNALRDGFAPGHGND